jgi:multicomponent Na+:H+ antiporter subunit G
MNLDNAVEILASAAMLLGAFLMVVTGIGLLRFPDVYCRMHAAGKAGTVGVSLLILAPMIYFFDSQDSVLVRGAMAIFFQFLTTPAATHLLAQACYLTGYPVSSRTAIDELRNRLPNVDRSVQGRE